MFLGDNGSYYESAKQWEEVYHEGALLGDPRRCRTHDCVTSSPDGMFDTPCPMCEQEDYYADCAEASTAAYRASGSLLPYTLWCRLTNHVAQLTFDRKEAARVARPTGAYTAADDIPF